MSAGIIFISLLAAIIAAGVGIFFALYALGFFQYLGGKKCNPNAVKKETIYQRLLSINNPSKPYQVISGEFDHTDIIVEWKFADASWYGIFNKNGLKKAYKALLLLDEKRHSVRCFEILGTVNWTAGTAGLMPIVHYSQSRFGGRILFQKSSGVGYGVKNLKSMELDKVYEYHFDVNEIRDPLKKTVEELGWEWVPVTAKRHAIFSSSQHENIAGIKSDRYCIRCGSRLRPEDIFCSACGMKTTEKKKSSSV
ncbi:MAG: zinc ribbon domain-containing protein [Syntrophaceae bacterium]|nr:zinc ribbon domain-containing protein [Syntrophaceae bacterium]